MPAPLTSFVGRERDLAVLEATILDARLSSLVGPGGVGKSRLALEAARRSGERFAAGTALVELAPIAAGSSVISAFATSLGVADSRTLPTVTDRWSLAHPPASAATAINPTASNRVPIGRPSSRVPPRDRYNTSAVEGHARRVSGRVDEGSGTLGGVQPLAPSTSRPINLPPHRPLTSRACSRRSPRAGGAEPEAARLAQVDDPPGPRAQRIGVDALGHQQHINRPPAAEPAEQVVHLGRGPVWLATTNLS